MEKRARALHRAAEPAEPASTERAEAIRGGRKLQRTKQEEEVGEGDMGKGAGLEARI